MVIRLVHDNSNKLGNNIKGKLVLEEDEWHNLLKMASDCEWDPEGTLEPSDWKDKANGAPWSGGYLPARSQKVSESDADEIAYALKQALEEIRLSEYRSEYEKKHTQDLLREAIDFLRGGEFSISESGGRGWWS